MAGVVGGPAALGYLGEAGVEIGHQGLQNVIPCAEWVTLRRKEVIDTIFLIRCKQKPGHRNQRYPNGSKSYHMARLEPRGKDKGTPNRQQHQARPKVRLFQY